MPLPDSREETATAASQVRSTTINAIQDAIIALGNPLVGRWHWYAPSHLGQRFTAGGAFTDNFRELVFPVGPNTGQWMMSLMFPVGTRILSIGARYKHVAAEGAGKLGNMTLVGYRQSIDGTGIGQTVAGTPAGTGGHTFDLNGNNGAGALWAEDIGNIEQTQTHAVMQANYTYQLSLARTGAIILEGVGIKVLPDNTH